ncbi:bifunctional cystathionine gamma-lyase/homocysteine desulfhydrase [Fulvivirga kasyanovii]|uniref:PLP-dependent transferase n=1 Tax=Fulvivirga kasyanovii TaxID=396812 RepID=A0ABW9RVW2_9BACT|nr:PLP-dependent aspartate aminotransferase family protein [Fulvivirga kasyanovii]MTI27394.1 PLP-dependent transferase [Fulvivirga kasyanovii]
MKSNNKATQCVHSGSIIDPVTRGAVTPIYTSTAYDYIDVDIHAYPRYFNTPNQRVVSEKLAALENGERAITFGSGMAAISTTLFALLRQGDHAVFQNDLYGGTHHAITKEMEKYGIEYTLVDGMEVSDYEKAIKPNTRLLYIETPSNPLLKIIDIKAIAGLAKANNIVSVIDNTFASPINQNPVDLGIDVVVHSGTKYLGGHSDICCGIAVTSNELGQHIWESAIHFGGSLNAQMCYLLERSLKTLALRVRQQNSNAQTISEFLDSHKKVNKVYYPGLTNHEGHELAKSQMSGFGGMLSFEVKTDPDKFVKALQMIKPAMSLGGIESTITSPRQTSHSKISAEERAKVGISDYLLRLSVGIEDANDLISDLDKALNHD